MKARLQNNSALPLGDAVDPTPAQRPRPVILQGRFGRVEQLDAKMHASSLWQAAQQDDTIWAYFAYGPFKDEAELKLHIESLPADKNDFFYALVDLNGNCTGTCGLIAVRPEMKVCEVAHVIYTKALQRTIFGTEAQYLLMRHVFEDLGYRRYEWKCNALNEKSNRAAMRYGFTYEGTFRQHMITRGTNRDTAWYSILDKEWPALKENFERWLAADNFDEDGQQKTPLKISVIPAKAGI